MGTTTLMSVKQFLELEYEEQYDLELLEGELIRTGLAKRRHMEIVERLFKGLDSAVEQLRASQPSLALGEVHVEMGYILSEEPPTSLKPDVSITLPNQPGEDYYEGSPLFVFEVVSPSDKAEDLNRKVHDYLTHGAAEVWLFYQKERQAWVHLRGERTARLEEDAVRSALLPGIEIPFAKIFE